MNLKRLFTATAVLCLALAFVAGPATAADTPTSDAYSGIAGQVGSGGGGSDLNETAAAQDEGAAAPSVDAVPVAATAEAAAPSQSGVLPFTGLQAGLLALVAVALVGCGLVLRRVARSTP